MPLSDVCNETNARLKKDMVRTKSLAETDGNDNDNDNENENEEVVILSTNPGRYLCNYVYYCSLMKSSAAVFIHVVDANVISLETQHNAVVHTIRGIIHRQIDAKID